MDKLEFRGRPVILKTTFKTPSKYIDAFIDPNGYCTKVEHMHHVEMALRILERLTEEYFNEVRKANDKIRNYHKGVREVSRLDESDIIKYIIDYYPSLQVTGETSEEVRARFIDRLHDMIAFHRRTIKNIGYSELHKFKLSNRNRGYDSAEYLVINKGFLALEGGYVIYSPSIKYDDDLLMELGFHQVKDEDGNYILVYNTSEWLEDKHDKELSSVMSSYWMTAKDIFHCPGGYPRYGFVEWTKKCEKLGINPYKLRRDHRVI